MQYLLLIYEDERNYMDKEPSPEMFKPWFDYTDATKDAGVYVAGAGLQPTPTATTVRVRDGKTMTMDGPFAETKEQLGGYYLLDCKDLDEAISWAEKIPSAPVGSIEVRPLMQAPA